MAQQGALGPPRGHRALIGDIENNRATLVVSVNTFTEMLRAKHSAEQAEAFDAFLRRSSVIRVDVSFSIAQKAEQTRSRAITLFKKSQRRSITTSDAQIIATAIVRRCDVLHSLEPQHQDLSKHECFDGLLITAPMELGGQKALGLDLDPA